MPQASRTASCRIAGALALALAAASPTLAGEGFGLDDFDLSEGQDLLDICTLDESHANHWEAKAFCFGYFQGGADFHRAMVGAPQYQPIVCAGPSATVEDAVAVFIVYARAHPEHLAEPPMDVVFRAVTEQWPCR